MIICDACKEQMPCLQQYHPMGLIPRTNDRETAFAQTVSAGYIDLCQDCWKKLDETFYELLASETGLPQFHAPEKSLEIEGDG
jgi:hypothetical protein